jgi:signal transduction histidine kinase
MFGNRLELKSFCNPLAALTGFTSLLALGCLLFIYFTGLNLSQLGVTVRYVPTNQELVIVKLYEGPTAAKALGLKPGDRIRSFDGLSLPTFATTKRMYISDAADYPIFTLPRQLYSFPFPENVEMTLASVEAVSIGVGRSENGQTQDINLHNFLPNAASNSLLTVQLLVGLIFWLISFLLFMFQPSKTLSFWFVAFFGATGIYLVGNITGDLILNLLVFTVLVFTSLVCSISFVYFTLLFPFGEPPGRKIRGLFLLLTLVYAAVSSSYLGVGLTGGGDSPLGQLLLSWRLRLLALASFGGLAILLGKFLTSTGQERARIKLVVIAFLLSATVPITVFALYTTFGWFADLAVNYFGFLSVFSLLFPVACFYALLKHQLFYPDFLLRRLLLYVFLAGVLLGVYIVSQATLNFVLYNFFGIADSNFSFLAFIVVALAASELKSKVQIVVDQLFYRDKPDYTLLVKRWMVKIIQNSASLPHLTSLLSREAATDFRYERIGVLFGNLRHKTEAAAVYNKASLPDCKYVLLAYYTPPTGGVQSGASKDIPTAARRKTKQGTNADGYELDSLISSQALTELGLNVELLEKREVERLLQSREPVYQLSPDVDDYAFFIPFDRRSSLSGGLFFANKLSQQLPTREEINSLISLTQQAALAISVALEIQKEQHKTRLIRAFLVRQDNLTYELQQKVARELHDTAIQEACLIQSRLDTWLTAYDQDKESQDRRVVYIREAFAGCRRLQKALRQYIQRLRPCMAEFGLTTVMKETVVQFSQFYPRFEFTAYTSITLDQDEELGLSKEEIEEINRIIGEGLQNVVKHSSGNRVLVELVTQRHPDDATRNNENGEQTQLVLRIHDDGEGYDMSKVQDISSLILQGHFGLAHLHERVQKLGGKVELGCSKLYGGACLEFQLALTGRSPLTEEAQAAEIAKELSAIRYWI